MNTSETLRKLSIMFVLFFWMTCILFIFSDGTFSEVIATIVIIMYICGMCHEGRIYRENPTHLHHRSNYNVMFFILVATVFFGIAMNISIIKNTLSISCFGLIYANLYSANSRTTTDQNNENYRALNPGPAIDINSLNTHTCPHEEVTENCTICLYTYIDEDQVVILPCKHYFHKNCLSPWLVSNRTCPQCRSDIDPA